MRWAEALSEYFKSSTVDTRVRLKVQGLTSSSRIHAGAYALVLAEIDGCRRIPVVVGTPEAQSIAIALEHIVAPRPLTHDLFVAFCHAFSIELKEVYIYKYMDGVFYSELRMEGNGREVQLDSRTSDAIALALRMDCPIFTSEEIMQECSITLEQANEESDEDEYAGFEGLEPEDIHDEDTMKRWLASLSPEDLQDRLDEAVDAENYEYAKMYQDELKRRKA